ncbi:Reticulon-4-interacting protein 1-like protein, mitochondrial, partial [Stegodyphus mimosarum]
MNIQQSLNCYSNILSPSFLCGIAGVVTISVVSNLHVILSRKLKNVYDKRRRKKQLCMKGIGIKSYNGISSVEIRSDLPIPKIVSEDDVLIKVIAAGFDEMDLKIASGYGKSIRSHLEKNSLHAKSDSFIILGRECAGIVLDVGSNVESVAKGDEVWAVAAYCLDGLMAEYVVVKEDQVALKPSNISFEEAASIPYSAIQVWNALVTQANLNPSTAKGKRVLVHAGNSPISLFAIQLLKSWRSYVTTTVPTAGLPMSHVLNVDDVIVYTVMDFEAELRKRKRFDIILNTVGTIIHQLCVDICSEGGTVITFVSTPILSDIYGVFLGSLLALGLQVVAWVKKMKNSAYSQFWWDNFSYDKKCLNKTSALIEEEKIHPIVERIYDMDDALSGFQQLAQYENVGKNVLRISTAKLA